MARLGGKVAVVTGAASGFGRATVRLLAAEGARVVVADLDEGNAKATVAQIVDRGGEADLFVGDVSDRASADDLVGHAFSRFGGLHVLVNNAGIVQERPLSYTRHVAVEVAPEVRVNCVSPGYMWTPMSTGERSGLTPEQQEVRRSSLGGMSPMGRVGAADDIANAILFLASDEAGFVTGQELIVDGGHVVTSWPRPTAPIA